MVATEEIKLMALKDPDVSHLRQSRRLVNCEPLKAD
jgi:hypothetical protein